MVFFSLLRQVCECEKPNCCLLRTRLTAMGTVVKFETPSSATTCQMRSCPQPDNTPLFLALSLSLLPSLTIFVPLASLASQSLIYLICFSPLTFPHYLLIAAFLLFLLFSVHCPSASPFLILFFFVIVLHTHTHWNTLICSLHLYPVKKCSCSQADWVVSWERGRDGGKEGRKERLKKFIC